MITDKAEIEVRSGKGGDGCVSFRHEKYVPNGGPDGGDGGCGGNVVLISDSALNNLGEFRIKRRFAARNGENGAGAKCSGKNADDLYIKVPVGTVVFDKETGKLLFDFTQNEQSFTAVKGGRGGNGNQHYATSTRQAPKFSKPGDPAQEKTLILELKILADVGLIGFPNVGKSTLLSMLTNAKPKIADYHFTTLYPNLGIVKYKNATEFVMADIPGLIEGASLGQGLGHDFLRHIERTRLLVHLIDVASSEDRDPIEDFGIINNELYSYSEALKSRPQIVVLNKADLLADKSTALKIKEHFTSLGYDTFITSAATSNGLSELLDKIVEKLKDLPKTHLFFTQEETVFIS